MSFVAEVKGGQEVCPTRCCALHTREERPMEIVCTLFAPTARAHYAGAEGDHGGSITVLQPICTKKAVKDSVRKLEPSISPT
jgi:hypothetical protein